MGFEKFAKFILILDLLLSFLSPFFRWQPLNYASTALLLLVSSICVVFFFQTEKRPILRKFGFLLLFFCILTFFNWLRFPKSYLGGEDGFFSTSHQMTGTLRTLLPFFLIYRLKTKELLSIHSLHRLAFVSTSHQMTGTLRTLLSFFLIYRLKTKELLSIHSLHRLAFVFFILAIPAFILDYYSLDFGKYGNSVNTAYALIYIYFLLSLDGFNIKNTLYLVIIFGFVVFSAKRGAMISIAIVSAFFLFYRWRGKVSRLFMIPIAVGTLAIMANYIYNSNENLQLKMEGTQEGNYSGRNYMNEVLVLNFLNQDTEHQIFGFAFAGSVLLLDMDAHNDYLEILTSQGLLGLVFYIFILIYFLVLFFKARSHLKPHEKFIILSGILMWYVRAYVSQTVYGSDAILFIMAFTFIIAGLPKEAMSKRYRLPQRNKRIFIE